MAITYEAIPALETVSHIDLEQVGNANLYAVVSGCTVTESGSDMVVTIAAGVALVNGASVTVAGNTITLVADATNKRWSYATINSSGVAVLVSGTPAASALVEPTKPDPAGKTILKMYKVEAAQTIASAISVKPVKRIIAAASVSGSTGVRNDFRVNRRKVAEYMAGGRGGDTLLGGTTGITLVVSDANDDLTTISGEPIHRFNVNLIGSPVGMYTTNDGGTQTVVLSPNHSPRMLVRVQMPAVSANVTYWLCGFFSTAAATAAGAFLRIATTGNVFFVTDQAGTETVTDLGALSRTTVLGFEIETADAGVTWVCRNQAGTALATHTTNVPTAGTALEYGVVAGEATAAVPWGVAYFYLEGTFA